MKTLTLAGLAAPLALLSACAAPMTADAPPAMHHGAAPDGGGAAAARHYVDRIARLDDAGPMLNAVIAHDRGAAAKADALRGTPLAGRTVLVKDNIETREWPTTAGSEALRSNATGRDAPLIANLRAAGGLVLGKTNLSEWANIRSTHSTSGWSAIGGLTRNPHATDRNSCGSSSGSGAAVAAGLAWAAIGTETDGSITCPASVNGVVGFKPTVGMVSRTHVIPISHSQDTAGPMARSVADAAMLLTAIAGPDPADPATAEAASHRTDLAAGLDASSLRGVRIGVLTNQVGDIPGVTALFEQAKADLEAAGAVLVPIAYEPDPKMYEDEFAVLLYELREDLGAYLAGSPADIPIRTLDDAVAFNIAHADTEMRWFDQDIFVMAQDADDPAAYEKARTNSLRLAKDEGIDALMEQHDVRVLLAPTTGPAWPSDLIYGDNYPGGVGAGSLAAIAGTPHLTVPMGAVEGLPVGLSFMGGKWADRDVLAIGAAYERARTAPLAVPDFAPWQQ
ncbi:amidase [uncultured Croceicoccus sp.]|uniref:amidase n=1 Tax=uncultured Croceicoccus sp. TaxID=1295329 RepID=UPI00261672E7|nr:amidase [uncultured Croceicoccus sp.]